MAFILFFFLRGKKKKLSAYEHNLGTGTNLYTKHPTAFEEHKVATM
jgi:hypothetical protein